MRRRRTNKLDFGCKHYAGDRTSSSVALGQIEQNVKEASTYPLLVSCLRHRNACRPIGGTPSSIHTRLLRFSGIPFPGGTARTLRFSHGTRSRLELTPPKRITMENAPFQLGALCADGAYGAHTSHPRHKAKQRHRIPSPHPTHTTIVYIFSNASSAESQRTHASDERKDTLLPLRMG